MKAFLKSIIPTLFIIINFNAIAQEIDEDNDTMITDASIRGFHIGFFAGSFLANNYTANIYDGYGLDNDGNKNDFENSFLYRKIITEYGGGNGLGDRIAQELKVDHGNWNFDKSDMPKELKFNPAFMMGLQTHYCLTKKEAFLMNLNFSKLKAYGNFTITTAIPANKRVNKPSTKATPVAVSITPAKPIKLVNCTAAPFPAMPPNVPSNFCTPCCKNNRPTTTLNTK